MRRLLIVLLLVTIPALVAVTPLPAAAQTNLVTNGEFDTNDLSGWTNTGSSSRWSDLDADGDMLSGSLETSSLLFTNTFVEVRWCASVVAGESYVFGADVLVPSGQTPGSRAFVRIFWYGNPDCVSALVATESPESTQDMWIRLEDEAVAPPTTLRAQLSLGHGWLEIGDAVVRHDNAFLFLPEPGQTALAFAALATVALLRLRRIRPPKASR